MYTLDDDKKLNGLLRKNTLLASRLDVCLERSFESFQLQLVRNPVKVNVMGMFSITRSSVAAMLGSILMYTILLIQCDLEHY
ncbi:putative gustatory receptor 36b [Drosophila biarmipes]|uniref:putative gustatory receptor 36b n=1 Tax=Drosophila biarmipes TaxID=125945 RepID=UPI0021CCAF13|nr:putative gustatory receptor 36b [Drosophila biarmipes]